MRLMMDEKRIIINKRYTYMKVVVTDDAHDEISGKYYETMSDCLTAVQGDKRQGLDSWASVYDRADGRLYKVDVDTAGEVRCKRCGYYDENPTRFFEGNSYVITTDDDFYGVVLLTPEQVKWFSKLDLLPEQEGYRSLDPEYQDEEGGES